MRGREGGRKREKEGGRESGREREKERKGKRMKSKKALTFENDFFSCSNKQKF